MKYAKSLKSLIRKEKKSHFRQKVIDSFKTIYKPSITSFLYVFLLVALFFVGAHYISSEACTVEIVSKITPANGLNLHYIFENICFTEFGGIKTPYIDIESNHYQNLIAIHSGIGVIIFSLIIFIAEGLRDEKNRDTGRILLRQSYLWPLVVAEILVFFIFIWWKVTFLSVIPIFIIALFSIISLARIVLVLINKHKFKLMRIALYKERFLESIDLEVTKRIGNNILVGNLAKFDEEEDENDPNKIKLQFNPFAPYRDEEKYYELTSPNAGVICNINLRALNELAEKLEEEARKKGFTFASGKKIKSDISDYDTTETSSTTQSQIENSKNRERYCTQEFLATVEKGDTLICFDKKLVDEQSVEKLQKLIPKIFKVCKEKTSFNEQVVEELHDLTDESLLAVKEHEERRFERLTEFFVELSIGFLEELKKYGGGFSNKQAKQERGAIFGGIKAIGWLSDSIRDIFIKSVQSKDHNIMRTGIYLPLRIAIKSIDFKDFYLFQEFILHYPVWIYKEGVKIKDNNEKSGFLKDRAGTYLKEIVEFILESKLKNKKIEPQEFRDYIVNILKVFQNLLMSAYESEDEEFFQKFASIIDEVFDYEKQPYKYNSRDLPSELKEIGMLKNQVFFGVASWILAESMVNLKSRNLKFYNYIKNKTPHTTVDLTNIFLDAHNFEVENFWGWGDCELRGKYDGRVHCIQILEKLEQFFAVRSLELLQNKNKEEILSIELPHNRDLAFLAEGTRDLLKVLKDIEENPNNWKKVLSKKASKKVKYFKILLENARLDQEKDDLEKKRSKHISDDKVKDFRADVVKKFKRNKSIRLLLENFNLFSDKTDQSYSGRIKRKGINTVFDKAAFFDSWHVHFVDSGSGLGRSMALGENSILIRKIEEKCQKIDLKQISKKIKRMGKFEDIFILATHHAVWDYLRRSDNYEDKWYSKIEVPQISNFEGWYIVDGKRVPVFSTIVADKKDRILLLNKKKLGKLHQYSPLNSEEESDRKEDIFYIDVQEFLDESELMTKYIAEPPEWLKEKGGKEKQKQYLKEKVLIYISQRFNFRISQSFLGFFIEI